ncbi:MAG: 3'-5' exonuclease [Nanoarchaeota archaeon]
MIVLDIESSGIDTGRCGIWQIGAVEIENSENQFLEESRIDDEDLVEKGAIKVTGKTEEQMRDSNKQSQKELILKFLEWTRNCKDRIIIGQNIGWDLIMLQNKCIRYNLHKELRDTIGFKGLDTYSIAQIKHLEKKGNLSIKEDGRGNMGLHKVLEFCGIKDNRMDLDGEEVVKEGTPHNALEDAKLTGECFSRLMFGKNLFPEFSKFEIPEEIKK